MQIVKPYYFLIPMVILGGIVIATNYNGNKEAYKLMSEETGVSNDDFHAYNTVMDVLTHERCINCHPNDNIPKQGDDSHPHYYGISRGDNNHGFEATQCATCHQNDNNAYSGVPGAPEWSLAPDNMKWEGLTRAQIARSMIDIKKNGNRNHEELIKHLTEDALVLWAWSPGIDAEGIEREKPPISLEAFKKAVYEWFENGALIPEE